MRSLHGSEARPLTCAQPVSPGFTASLPRCRSSYCATCASIVGRGPTMAISPRTTLNRFGSSSSDSRRRTAPTRVMRSSPSRTAMPACSAPAHIVRSFHSVNGTPSLPIRRWP
jgi:hypothetical protein